VIEGNRFTPLPHTKVWVSNFQQRYWGIAIAPDFAMATNTQTDLPPCQRLYYAMLDEAVTTLQRNATMKSARARRLYADARDWVRGSQAVVTFETCCYALNIDPSWLRRIIEENILAKEETKVC